MYSNNDDMYEVGDLDEDIRSRKALIEEIKQLDSSADFKTVFQDILNLKRKWKRIPYWDSAYEDELEAEFESYVDVFFKQRNDSFKGNEASKQELIEQAKKLVASNDLKNASKEMNELMEQWKCIGSAGKEIDDTLWEDFNGIRQSFFDLKHDHWEELQTKFANAKVVKTKIIEQAKAIAHSEDFQQTSKQFRDLMKEWTAAGSAGREFEDHLWNEFNESRQVFYERRNVYYESKREEQQQYLDKKSELVKKAETIAQSKQYSRENTNQMNQLGIDWKGIGACDNETENKIWKQFRSAMDDYFNGLRHYNEQKHKEWQQRLMDNRNRKLDLIQKQKRQINYMKEEMVGLLGQRAIDDMLEDIEEKNEFIKELEAELMDIDKKLKNEN